MSYLHLCHSAFDALDEAIYTRAISDAIQEQRSILRVIEQANKRIQRALRENRVPKDQFLLDLVTLYLPLQMKLDPATAEIELKWRNEEKLTENVQKLSQYLDDYANKRPNDGPPELFELDYDLNLPEILRRIEDTNKVTNRVKPQ